MHEKQTGKVIADWEDAANMTARGWCSNATGSTALGWLFALEAESARATVVGVRS
jgi:hypothetical protein